MNKMFLLLAIILIFLIALKLLSQRLGGNEAFSQEHLPYVKRKYLLTPKERELFLLLHELYGAQFHIFPQVHIASLLYVKSGERKWQTYFNKIIRKSVDFVLFDKENIGPVLGIELDDKTHEQSRRAERDAFVDSAFGAAQIPLVHIKTHELDNKDEVRQRIDSVLQTIYPSR